MVLKGFAFKSLFEKLQKVAPLLASTLQATLPAPAEFQKKCYKGSKKHKRLKMIIYLTNFIYDILILVSPIRNLTLDEAEKKHYQRLVMIASIILYSHNNRQNLVQSLLSVWFYVNGCGQKVINQYISLML
jgi:hypothetical protein